MPIILKNKDGVLLKTAGKYCPEDITVVPQLQEKTVTSNGKVTPDANYAGLSGVTVNVQAAPTLKTKTVTPTKSQQNIAADSGYDGLSSVIVNAIPDNYVIPTGTVNITANGILTSCRLSNKYRIEDMRYIGEKLISDEQEKAYFERIENKRK